MKDEFEEEEEFSLSLAMSGSAYAAKGGEYETQSDPQTSTCHVLLNTIDFSPQLKAKCQRL
jgi:hypothetical protein